MEGLPALRERRPANGEAGALPVDGSLRQLGDGRCKQCLQRGQARSHGASDLGQADCAFSDQSRIQVENVGTPEEVAELAQLLVPPGKRALAS